MEKIEWENFKGDLWKQEINVKDFISKNFESYLGDETFLESSTEKTLQLFEKIKELMNKELEKGGVLDVETKKISTITSHGPGYLDKDLEVIVGFQTDKPLKRGLMPFGGIRMVEKSFEEYGYTLDNDISKIFNEYRKTHNQGVFDAYTSQMRKARKSHVLTGLPDAYGRGRIIGDYRRIALYGTTFLINKKIEGIKASEDEVMTEEIIRKREELTEQVRALNSLEKMAMSYGFDITVPAKNAQEATQWTYFGYLAAIKEQNGAAMSIGRISTFLDIYINRDISRGILDEKGAQEIIDQLVLKLRMVRFLRTREYNNLFSGDPNWVTESIGGMAEDNRPLVTKTSYRMLNTLINLGPAPEPNLTVLWSTKLPESFKKFCTKISIETSSIQYENDDIMSKWYGDDYAIACCVSPMRVGKQMQFFGARCNLAKLLLYAINDGRDEISGAQVGPKVGKITTQYLDYDEVMEKYKVMIDWIAKLYINTLNIIHYMHDKYSYEAIQMALHDDEVIRTMACGIAGLSVVADSLSAIKYSKVEPLRNEEGLIVDFFIQGDHPTFGNDDERVDSIAHDIQTMFMDALKKQKTYRNSIATMSILTITSNVVYGENTGTTPDGRFVGEAFAPGANPMYNREKNGIVAAMSSLSKLEYASSQDGISYTFSALPTTLGKDIIERKSNLAVLLDTYFTKGSQHINVNVLNKELLYDAMVYPEKYPQLTVRVSGYAVNFVKLTRKQQEDIVSRTFF